MIGECSRCGACCRTVPLQTKAMSPEYLNYLRTRGLQEAQGFILIPHDCQHLKEEILGDEGTEYVDCINTRCDIHESPERPKICQIFHGQKRSARAVFYVPPGCTMREQ